MSKNRLAFAGVLDQVVVTVAQTLGAGPLRQGALHPAQAEAGREEVRRQAQKEAEKARFQAKLECETLNLFAGLFHQR
jgi:hypothetical protein